MRITYTEPRKRKGWLMNVVPDNISFVTIEADGSTVYDSRIDVPCDMDEWHATNARFKGDRPGRTRLYRNGVLVSDSADDPDPEPPEAPTVSVA